MIIGKSAARSSRRNVGDRPKTMCRQILRNEVPEAGKSALSCHLWLVCSHARIFPQLPPKPQLAIQLSEGTRKNRLLSQDVAGFHREMKSSNAATPSSISSQMQLSTDDCASLSKSSIKNNGPSAVSAFEASSMRIS